LTVASASARYSSSSGDSSDGILYPSTNAVDITPSKTKGTAKTNEKSKSQSLESILSCIRSGVLLPAIPAGTSQPIATLVQECWHCWAQQPERHPLFLEIETRIDSLKQDQVFLQAWALLDRQSSGGNSSGLSRLPTCCSD
jgi:hypothetical protein